MQPTPNPVGVRADLAKFAKKAYRDGYLETRVRNGVAAQVRALREKLGLSQTEFGKLVGKPQTVVSRLEDPDYGRVSIRSLLDVAEGANVALVIEFVSYPEFLARTGDGSTTAPTTIDETLAGIGAETRSQED
jgi:transcriptional regulator with XRE-family HTH domain